MPGLTLRRYTLIVFSSGATAVGVWSWLQEGYAIASSPHGHHDRKATSRRLRARVRHAAFTAAPIWLTGGRLRLLRHDRPLAVVQRAVYLPELPDALDGLRIAHMSDLHIGQLTTPRHLPHIIDSCLALRADLIALTGDFLDLSVAVLDDVVHALRRLQAPLGVYLVPGNHDYLDDAQRFLHGFRAAGLNLMVNQTTTVEREGCRLRIAGVDFAHEKAKLSKLVHRTLSTLPSRRRDAHGRSTDFKLLLAHHPDAFDAAHRHGVDLTLSGHTHGGQVVLAQTAGRRGVLGLGGMAFRYPRGLYRRGNSYLYVTSGVGSWFPLRIKCPPEVVCLTLRSGPGDSHDPSHPADLGELAE